MTTPQQALVEVYAGLKALLGNLPDRPGKLVETRYVQEFHTLLALLQSHSSFDLSRFKVPTGAIVVRAGQEGMAVDLDSGFDWYDASFVKMKLEALLGFFELQWSEPRPKIGFRPQ
jgi:hypothetical protein